MCTRAGPARSREPPEGIPPAATHPARPATEYTTHWPTQPVRGPADATAFRRGLTTQIPGACHDHNFRPHNPGRGGGRRRCRLGHGAASPQATPLAHSASAGKEITMDFVSARIITDDVARLAGFYERATGVQASRPNENFAEIATASAALAIASTRTVPPFAPGAARQPHCHHRVPRRRRGRRAPETGRHRRGLHQRARHDAPGQPVAAVPRPRPTSSTVLRRDGDGPFRDRKGTAITCGVALRLPRGKKERHEQAIA
jgi:hypothetical protein